MRGDGRRCLVKAGHDKGKHDGELTEERSVQGAPSGAPTLRKLGKWQQLESGGELPPGRASRLNNSLAGSLGGAPVRLKVMFKDDRTAHALLLFEFPTSSRSSSV